MTTGAPELVIGIPSRNRLDSLRRCINSIAATVGMPFRICVLFGDDELSYKFLPPYPYVQRKNVTPRGWYNADTNATFDFMKETGEVDYFVITQDDSEFLYPGWGPFLIEDVLHKYFPNGMGAAEFFNPAGFSNYIARAAVFDQFDGKLLPTETGLKHYFADSVRRHQLGERKQFVGVGFKQPTAAIMHHPTYATTDPLGLEARERWFKHDQEIYESLNPR